MIDYNMARPTKYTDKELISKAKEFLELESNFSFPSINKLSKYLKLSRETIYARAKKSKELSDTLDLFKLEQEERLIDNGLNEVWNSGFAKFLLSANHGYKEISKSELSGVDGKAIEVNSILKPSSDLQAFLDFQNKQAKTKVSKDYPILPE